MARVTTPNQSSATAAGERAPPPVPDEIGAIFRYPTHLIHEFTLNPRPVNAGQRFLKEDIRANGQIDPIRVAPHPDDSMASRSILMIVAGGNSRLRVLRQLKIPTALCVRWRYTDMLTAVTHHMSENSLHQGMTQADKVRVVGRMREALSANLHPSDVVGKIISCIHRQKAVGLSDKPSTIYYYLHAHRFLRHWHLFDELKQSHIKSSQERWSAIRRAMVAIAGDAVPAKGSDFWEHEVFAAAGRELAGDAEREAAEAVAAGGATAGENVEDSLNRYLLRVCRVAGRHLAPTDAMRRLGFNAATLGDAIAVSAGLLRLPGGLSLPSEPWNIARMMTDLEEEMRLGSAPVMRRAAPADGPGDDPAAALRRAKDDARWILRQPKVRLKNLVLTPKQAVACYRLLMRLGSGGSLSAAEEAEYREKIRRAFLKNPD